VVRLGHLPEREFWRVASATDVCINLRNPSAAETSAIAIRCMGLGKPVIVSSGEETAGFPANACLRVDPGARRRRDAGRVHAIVKDICLVSAPNRPARRGPHLPMACRRACSQALLGYIVRPTATCLIVCCSAVLCAASLPPPILKKLDARAPMRDGVRLSTNIFRPTSRAAFPPS